MVDISTLLFPTHLIVLSLIVKMLFYQNILIRLRFKNV